MRYGVMYRLQEVDIKFENMKTGKRCSSPSLLSPTALLIAVICLVRFMSVFDFLFQ